MKYIIKKIPITFLLLFFCIRVLADNVGEIGLDDVQKLKKVYPATFFSQRKPIKNRLVVSGQNITTEEGRDIKLYGVGIRVTNQLFDKYSKDTERLISMLMGMGVNYVRLMGIDFNDPGVFKEWAKTKKLNRDKMSSLCRLTQAFSDNGIYYTLSLNHYKNKLKYLGVKPILEKGGFRYGQFIYPMARETVKSWMSELITYSGGDCRNSFIADKAFMHMDIINEESLWGALRRKERLTDLAENDLKKQIKSVSGIEIEDIYDPSSDTSMKIYQYEKDIGNNMGAALRQSGFKGMLSYTNKWYGYGTLALNANIGDLIETHVYFDHPKGISKSGNKSKKYSLSNVSYLSDTPWSDKAKGYDSSNALRKIGIQQVDNMPMLVTEWNHSSLSEFAYEGVVVLPLFSAQHSVSGIAAHTLFPRQGGYIGTDPFALSAHPAFIALSPSLSFAYREDLITSLPSYTSRCGTPEDIQFHKKIIKVGLRNQFLDGNRDFRELEYQNNRLDIRTNSSDKNCTATQTPFKKIINQISIKDNALIANTENFYLLMGESLNHTKEFHGLDIEVKGRGVITMISTVDKADMKEKILISLAGEAILPNVCENKKSFFTSSVDIKLCRLKGNKPIKMKLPTVKVINNSGTCRVNFPISSKNISLDKGSLINISSPWAIFEC